MEVKLEHPEKVYLPMYVISAGIAKDERLVQPSKVRSPILVKLLGIVTDVRYFFLFCNRKP